MYRSFTVYMNNNKYRGTTLQSVYNFREYREQQPSVGLRNAHKI